MSDQIILSTTEWTCLANNPQSGVSTWAMMDGDEIIIQTRQDASVLLDLNKAEKNAASLTWKGDSLHKVASVPVAAMYDGSFHEAAKDGDDKWVKKFLNDSDNAHFRTKEGNL